MYNSYKESEIDWIGNVPKEWEIKKLKYISNAVKTGLTPPTKEEKYFEDDDFDWYTPGDLGENLKLLNSNRKISKIAIQEKVAPLYERFTVLLVGIGATLGKVGIIEKPSSSNQQINAILFKSNYNPYYGAHYLTSISDVIVSFSNSSTLAILNQTKTKNILFIVPSKDEQDKIVKFLDQKTLEIDNVIASKEKLIELLKEYRQAIISEVITKGIDKEVKLKDSGIEWIGEIPHHWEFKKIKYIANIVLGKMLTNKDKGGYFLKPYLRAQNIYWEKVDLSSLKEMWFSENEIGKFKLNKNDLLVSEGGEVGRTAIWNNEIEECYIQNSVHKLTFNENHDSKYFLYLFLFYGKKGYFESIANRVSIAHLTREKLIEIKLLIPPLLEQKAIANFLEKKTSEIDQFIINIAEQIEQIKDYRQALISEAVTGKIDLRVLVA